MWQISGTWIWLPLYLFVFFAIIKTFKKHSILIIIAIVLTVVATDLISVLIKNSVHRLRPSHNPDFEGIIHIVNNYRGGKFGFVSSHAANCFGFAAFVSLLFSRKWIVFSITLWATVVSYSRLYLGVHYPADLVAGALLGVVIAFILFWLCSRINKLNRKVIPK